MYCHRDGIFSRFRGPFSVPAALKGAMAETMIEKHLIRKLVEHARGGDRQAFEALRARYAARLRSSVESWARFQLGPPLDADDVLQETLAVALEALPRFEWRGEDSFYLWLCGIARRVVSKHTRDAVKGQGPPLKRDVPAAGPSPSRALRRDERFDRLQGAIDALKPEYREVIRLARIEGLKVAQIAERMNRSSDSVKHLLARALKELKKGFGDTETFHLPHRNLSPQEGHSEEA